MKLDCHATFKYFFKKKRKNEQKNNMTLLTETWRWHLSMNSLIAARN
jgi:hypothetical protein